jgi:molecular chaperone IbpA
MTTLARLNNDLFNRAFIGFDSLFDVNALDAKLQHSMAANYPPHNLYKTSDTDYVIELAVTGFAKDEVTVIKDRNRLIVTGIQKNREPVLDSSVIHRGLALRNFEKSFTLGEHIEIISAAIDLGVLTIVLSQIIPEEQKPKLIQIK